MACSRYSGITITCVDELITEKAMSSLGSICTINRRKDENREEFNEGRTNSEKDTKTGYPYWKNHM